MSYPHVRLFGGEHDKPTIEDGVIIGVGTGVGQSTYIGKNARIGKHCKIMQHVTICKDAVIGDRVFIGPNSSLYNDKYPPTRVSQSPIIEDGAIICGGARIGPGVIVHRDAVAGMGANVIRDIPEGEVWIGNPARYHMSRGEYNRRQRILMESLL